jgi:hypothetical protein
MDKVPWDRQDRLYVHLSSFKNIGVKWGKTFQGEKTPLTNGLNDD